MAPVSLGPIAFDFGLDNVKGSFANCRLPRRTGRCLRQALYVAPAEVFDRGRCFVAQMLDQSGEGPGVCITQYLDSCFYRLPILAFRQVLNGSFIFRCDSRYLFGGKARIPARGEYREQ